MTLLAIFQGVCVVLAVAGPFIALILLFWLVRSDWGYEKESSSEPVQAKDKGVQ